MTSVGRFFLPALMLLSGTLCAPFPSLAHADDEQGLCDVFSVQLDNDEPGGSDRHYTGAIRFACVRPAPTFLNGLNVTEPPEDATIRSRSTYAFGLTAFTPDDLTIAEPIEGEQPYAGWLHVGLGLENEVSPTADRLGYLDSFELQLGIIGPWSGAEHVQRSSHDFLNATEPQGWGNQLDNEPGLNLFYNRQWTSAKRVDLLSGGGVPDLAVDITPELGLAFGNVHIFAAGGLTFRLGSFLPNDHGPPVIRPSLPGSDYFPEQEGFAAYVFGGLEGRMVGRNIFLDGNSYPDNGPSVEKELVVGEARLGLAVTYDDIRLAYTQVYRTREFEDQDRQTYGTVSLSFRL
ncbi:MAG: lipid A deacylase LpxR family protein [Geminicoccaceae bacterium]